MLDPECPGTLDPEPQPATMTINYRGETFAGYNDPKRTPKHSSKSHAVLAKEGDRIKLIRFGQQGVKGSPPKEGESEAWKRRRLAWFARHKKNIAKGKMSAAYWAAKTKWVIILTGINVYLAWKSSIVVSGVMS